MTEDAADTDTLAGRMLIATPAIGDPRFDRALVLLCAHSEDQAMGLIVNRPMGELSLEDLLGQLDIAPKSDLSDSIVLAGGPVDRERGFVLHSPDYESEGATLPVRGDISLTASKEILEAIAEDRGPDRSILALGYAGWGPGQLDEELKQNAWLVCEPTEALIYGGALEDKWETALQSIGVDPAKLSAMSGMA